MALAPDAAALPCADAQRAVGRRALITLVLWPAFESRRMSGAGNRAEWREIAWTFPRDGWPAGRAFRCASCGGGGGVELYVRPKIGFCNCDTGVADDDEVDRVADLDLISARFAPREPGKAVHVAGMAGRSRATI